MKDLKYLVEYLLEYGWMIIVVVIVGGAIFGTVEAQPVSNNSEGLPPNVDVFQYKEATCFMSNHQDGEGISCMPTSQVEGGAE